MQEELVSPLQADHKQQRRKASRRQNQRPTLDRPAASPSTQGRRQVFWTGGSKFFLLPPPSLKVLPVAEIPGFARISCVVLVEAGGSDPLTPLASAAPASTNCDILCLLCQYAIICRASSHCRVALIQFAISRRLILFKYLHKSRTKS
jgi:hypothetical protein